jgi:hypothetical protein
MEANKQRRESRLRNWNEDVRTRNSRSKSQRKDESSRKRSASPLDQKKSIQSKYTFKNLQPHEPARLSVADSICYACTDRRSRSPEERKKKE